MRVAVVVATLALTVGLVCFAQDDGFADPKELGDAIATDDE